MLQQCRYLSAFVPFVSVFEMAVRAYVPESGELAPNFFAPQGIYRGGSLFSTMITPAQASPSSHMPTLGSKPSSQRDTRSE